MIFVRQSVGVCEVGVQSAQLRRTLIHCVGKDGPVRGSGNMLRHREGHLVCGADQNCVQALLHGKRLPHIHGNTAASRRVVKDRVMGKADNLVHFA